jgi:tetratricopeptide (TPR) repeat protein
VKSGIARELALLVAVAFAFAPALGAGFLNYDDPWLIVNNPLMDRGRWDTPLRAFTDFSFETRYALGAEYLPLRDILVWLETRAFGKSAPPMHVVSVSLYAVSAVAFRRYVLVVFGQGLAAEVSAYLFALHPVHVESVAWLAGQKDVLSLLFVMCALAVHAHDGRRATWLVPLLCLGALLSKSMSVSVVVLLAATDLFLQRRPARARYALTLLAIAAAMAAHLHVGSIIGMIAEPIGGSRWTAFLSMGPVWLRYVGLCFAPWQLSIEHVVPTITSVSVEVLAGVGFVMASAALALRHRMAAFAFLWFFGPLAPVSQFIAPLQNHMADRYLWLSVAAPCMLAALALAQLRTRHARVATGLSILLCVSLGGATFARSTTFADSVLLFFDGTQKTGGGTRAPYQLGCALEEVGRDEEAMVAYREVLRRAPTGPEENARRATNNLARLLWRRGALRETERVLRQGLTRFHDDPKMRGNLAKVLRSTGRVEEAERWAP